MRTTEESVATLRHCATHNCIMCPAYSPPNSKCFETLAAACDRLEALEKELIDERYRHDRVQDFCVAQGEELSKIKRAAEVDSGDGLPERADMEGIENLLAEANADALGIMREE